MRNGELRCGDLTEVNGSADVVDPILVERSRTLQTLRNRWTNGWDAGDVARVQSSCEPISQQVVPKFKWEI